LSALVLFDFLLFLVVGVEAVVSLAVDLSEAAVLLLVSAASASFFAFFLDFFAVVVSELVSVELVELACAFVNAGDTAMVSIRQKAIIHRVSLV